MRFASRHALELLRKSSPTRFAGARRSSDFLLPIAMIVATAAATAITITAGDAGAHEQGYGFALADSPGVAVYNPDPARSYNDGGGAIEVQRVSTGVYTVQFFGLDLISTHGGTVQVSTTEPGTRYCNSGGWSSSRATVNCFDLGGSAADARFNVLYIRPDTHANNYGFAWVNDSVSATSTPSTSYSYNAGSADPVSVVHHRTGHYTVRWENLETVGSGPRIDLVTAYGTNARCQVSGTVSDGIGVRCHTPSGIAIDARFNALSIRPDSTDDGFGFGQASSPFSNGYTLPTNTFFNAGGGDVTAERLGPGDYSMTWSGLESVGINLGQIQVSADSFYDRQCAVTAHDENSASIRCFDSFGNPADSAYRALFLKPPKTAWSRNVGFAWANLPTATSPYIPSGGTSDNPGGGTILVTRTSTGLYSVQFAGYGTVPGGGHVQVTATGGQSNHCKVRGWSSENVSVGCYTANGALADTHFSVLYLKPSAEATSMAFAWANSGTASSYTPVTTYSFNPGGGTITVTRSSTGIYSITFPGFNTQGFNGGHVQVTAFGSTNSNCQVVSWGSVTANVRCFAPSGGLVDSPFTVLMLRPDPEDAALGFAWANQSTTSSYTPSTGFSFNSGGGSITGERFSPGFYRVTFNGLQDQGIDTGTVMVGAYGSTDRRCFASSWGNFSAFVRCYNASGVPSDSLFNILHVKRVTNTVLGTNFTPVPEPTGPAALLLGLLSLVLHERRMRRPTA